LRRKDAERLRLPVSSSMKLLYVQNEEKKEETLHFYERVGFKPGVKTGLIALPSEQLCEGHHFAEKTLLPTIAARLFKSGSSKSALP